ncbi:hypothetical protein ACWGI8_06060 [Streptomyces sp. NPDC054841]
MTSPAGGFGLADDPVTKAKIKIAQTGEAVTKQARELANIIETVSAGWTGAGAGGFKTAQVVINEDHDEIRRLLRVLYNAVAETKNLSNANDQEVDDVFKAAAAKSGLNNV